MYLWTLALNKCSLRDIELNVAPPVGPFTLYLDVLYIFLKA